MNLFNFFNKILMINLTTFGGGPLMIGHYEKEFVDDDIITINELNKYAAIGNILPGPMSFYVSGLIGHKQFGFKGLVLGIATGVFPIMFITIIVYNLLELFNFSFELVIIAVLPVIINNVIKYLKSMIKQKLDYKIKYSLFIISFLLLVLVGITSLQLVILFLFFITLFSIITRGKYVIS